MIGAWSSLRAWSVISSLRPCEIKIEINPPEAKVAVKVAISLKKKGYADGKI